MSAWFIVALVIATIALLVFVTSFSLKEETRYGDHPRRNARLGALAGLVIAFVFTAFSTIYTQSPGQARVIINLGGSVSHVDTTAGVGAKAPWQSVSTWDLLAQTVTYAGTGENAPRYTDGNVQGAEVTVSLARGVQSNIDAALTYSLTPDAESIKTLYTRFRSQENFTRQIVQNVILSTLREAPNGLTPAQFRGESRADVENSVLETLNEELDAYGVTVERVNLQDIRFSADVEESLRAVEVAQQREAEAEANLRATEIEAQAQVVQAEQAAAAAIAEAQGQSEANRLLSESLTPEILEQRRIEAMKAGTVFVVPEGSTPLVQVQP